MNWLMLSRIRAISVASVVMLSAARMASAQCDGAKRPPTVAEAKSYHDGFALFQRMAPPTPTGWTATDSNTDDISFVCPDAVFQLHALDVLADVQPERYRDAGARRRRA